MQCANLNYPYLSINYKLSLLISAEGSSGSGIRVAILQFSDAPFSSA